MSNVSGDIVINGVSISELVTEINRLRAEKVALKQLSRAVMDVIAERDRQQTKEGWTAEHDDEHDDWSLSRAAATYAYAASMSKAGRRRLTGGAFDAPSGWLSILALLWPRSWDIAWFKPKDRRRDLVRAAALIIADLERFDRADGR